MSDRPPDRLPENRSEAQATAPTRRRIGIFRNRFSHWRAGWRLTAYLVVTLVLGVGFAWVLGMLVPDSGSGALESVPRMLGWAVQSLALVVAGLVLLRFLDRRPMSLLGLGLTHGWLAELLIGLASGVVMVSSVVAFLLVVPTVTLVIVPGPLANLSSLPRYLLLFTLAAAAEELVFRGYPLQVLAEGSRRWIAVGMLCLLFAAGHLGNPDVTWVGIVNIFMLGALMAVIYFKTRRLWMPIGLHLSWNWAQSWLWGFDVSGITLHRSLLSTTPGGPGLLTGEGFGLEGSLVTTVVVVGVGWWLLRTERLTPAPGLADQWARFPSGYGRAPEVEVVEAEISAGFGDVDDGAGEDHPLI